MSRDDLTTAQRRHLDLAAAEAHQLNRITNRPTLTGYDWERAASLASSIAAHVDQVAVLAGTADEAEVWRRSAAAVRRTADRFELWASLADAADSIDRVTTREQA